MKLSVFSSNKNESAGFFENEENLNILRNATVGAINKYIETYKQYATDKGYRRAYFFRDIIKGDMNDQFPNKFRIFAIYTLLNEGNGVRLKECVRSALDKAFVNLNYSYVYASLENYINHEYQLDAARSSIMQKELLYHVHRLSDSEGYWLDNPDLITLANGELEGKKLFERCVVS